MSNMTYQIELLRNEYQEYVAEAEHAGVDTSWIDFMFWCEATELVLEDLVWISFMAQVWGIQGAQANEWLIVWHLIRDNIIITNPISGT